MTQHPSLTDQISNKCRHFNGLLNDTCEAGIRYADVRDGSQPGPYRFPCHKDNGCSERCPSVSYLTPDEVVEKERKISEVVTTFLTEMAQGICPHCHTKVEGQEQHGICIYNLPCGCRLGTGSVENSKENNSD